MRNNLQQITLLGMGDHPDAMLSEGKELLKNHRFFSGGKRHYELLKPLLPKEHTWIEISGKMNAVIDQYRSLGDTPLLIITSGDPFFFGFGNTMKRLLPEVNPEVVPWFSSIQRLCQKTQMNANELKRITLHGRPWKALDEALINGCSMIGILTDRKHSPKHISERLKEFGFNNYRMIVGEHLDGDDERISSFDLDDIDNYEFADLNAVILRKIGGGVRSTSFPDNYYRTLEGRPGMITKQALRAITIQALQLNGKSSMWDVGACTGAVAIEAKQQYAGLDVTAFEIREECNEIICENTRKTSTPGIEVFIGDFFEQNLDSMSHPDAVFIGGHGGRLKEMIQRIDNYLLPGGRLVMNTVSEHSRTRFIEATNELSYRMDEEISIQINDYNKITLLGATKKLI